MEKIYHCGKMLVLLILLLSASACGPADKREQIVLDIPAIAHKTQEQLLAILGQPDSSYYQKRGGRKIPVQLYQPHQIEVYFPAGKATEIVVNEPGPMWYNEASLSYFNIEPMAPNRERSKAAMKWSEVQGFKYITFFSQNIQADTVSSFRMFFNLADTASTR